MIEGIPSTTQELFGYGDITYPLLPDKNRCDYCGGHLGLIVDRYYRMRFCCKAHMSAYKQRLTIETRAKIRQLELLAPT